MICVRSKGRSTLGEGCSAHAHQGMGCVDWQCARSVPRCGQIIHPENGQVDVSMTRNISRGNAPNAPTFHPRPIYSINSNFNCFCQRLRRHRSFQPRSVWQRAYRKVHLLWIRAADRRLTACQAVNRYLSFDAATRIVSVSFAGSHHIYPLEGVPASGKYRW